MNNEIVKPIDVAMEELKINIAKLINESNITPYLVNYILKDLINECQQLSDGQLKNNTKTYQEQLQQQQNETTISNDETVDNEMVVEE